jgi:hypothetical protein
LASTALRLRSRSTCGDATSHRHRRGARFSPLIPGKSQPPISSSSRLQTCRLVCVLVILAHERRRVVHVAVTDHPTAALTAQQLREAFPWDQALRYLLRDREAAFHAWATTATAIGIDEVLTAQRSPWQNWGLRSSAIACSCAQREPPAEVGLQCAETPPMNANDNSGVMPSASTELLVFQPLNVTGSCSSRERPHHA